MVLKPENIPEPVRDTPRWVVFKVYSDRKIPVTIRGDAANITVPTTWSSLPEVLTAIDYGIGQYPALALAPDYPLRFYDLDDCIHDGSMTEFATKIVAASPKSYIERSASGTGIHIVAWVRGGVTIANGRFCNGLEIYSQTPRFCIFTGDLLDGSSPTVNEEPPTLSNFLAGLGTGAVAVGTSHTGTRLGKCGVVSAGAFRIPSVIAEGARNTELARIARYFHNRNLNDELLPLMQLINTKRCKPPLPAAELDALVKSALSVKHQIVGTPPHNSDVATLLELCAKAERLGMPHMDPVWIIDNVDAAHTACREYIMRVKV